MENIWIDNFLRDWLRGKMSGRRVKLQLCRVGIAVLLSGAEQSALARSIQTVFVFRMKSLTITHNADYEQNIIFSQSSPNFLLKSFLLGLF